MELPAPVRPAGFFTPLGDQLVGRDGLDGCQRIGEAAGSVAVPESASTLDLSWGSINIKIHDWYLGVLPPEELRGRAVSGVAMAPAPPNNGTSTKPT